MPLDDDSSDESQSDSVSETDDADLRSTTSLEEISRLTSNMLLYKAARARNIAVMLDALSQFADINWKNNDNYGRTPLIQAIFSVRMPCHSWNSPPLFVAKCVAVHVNMQLLATVLALGSGKIDSKHIVQ